MIPEMIHQMVLELSANYYFICKIREYTYCNDYTKIFKYILNVDNQKYVACPDKNTIDWICDNKPVGIKLRIPFEYLEIIPQNYCYSHDKVYCFCKKCTNFHKFEISANLRRI